MDGKWWRVLTLLLLGFSSYGQYVYTYTDPCTGVLNSVTITQPSGSVTLFYAGQYNTFTQAQLQAGAFELWVQGINATAPPGSNPCAGSGGTITTGTNAAVGSNTAANVSGIINIAAGISSSVGSGTSISSSGISNTSSSSSSGDSGGGDSGSGDGDSSGDGDGGDEGGSEGGSGSGSGSGGGRSTGGGSGSSGSSSNSSPQPTGSGGSSEGSGSTSGGTTEGSSTEETGALGGQSITSSSGGQSENNDSGGDSGGGGKSKSKQEKIGRGALIGAGDVVVIRNSSDIRESGKDNLKFNTSITHVNTKQNFIKGVNLNYTTGEHVANLTLYGSYKAPTFMGVFSNSIMTNFTSDWFNTTTVLGAQQAWKFTLLGGTNYTFGQLGKSNFGNWSIVGGAFTGFNGAKAIGGNVMLLGVYSPYIFYYEGQWYSSGLLFVPLANIDFKLTDKFKWSISFSGAYQYKADVLNYQLLTGTKMLL